MHEVLVPKIQAVHCVSAANTWQTLFEEKELCFCNVAVWLKGKALTVVLSKWAAGNPLMLHIGHGCEAS